jgi:hypothetical protein
MALEPNQTYRLVPRGEPGLTCDSEGAALGGIPIAWRREGDDGTSRWQTRSPDEIGDILQRAYGLQRTEVVNSCHRGLRRVTTHLEAGDLALAAIEALMLRLPIIDADGMAKLATSVLGKGGDASQDELRVPAGQPDGGQWTTGGALTAPPAKTERPSAADSGASATRPLAPEGRPSLDAPDSGPSEVNPEGTMSPEIVVQPPHRLSMKPNANGFLVDSAGRGVFYIPSATEGQAIRPTEVHALDANAFHVGWRDGVISLTDAKGNVVETGTTPAELDRFNATTGQALGVSIYAFPNKALAAPAAPPTAEEQRELDQESAALAEGKRESEQSWSGRATTGLVLVATALPFLALAPIAAETEVESPLNTAEELWPRGTEEIPASGAHATAQGKAYEAGIRSMYPKTTEEALRFGETGQYKADAVAEVFGKETAIDAKYVDEWGSSIRNPDSAIGDKSFAVEEQQQMLVQAKRYDEFFDVAAYITRIALNLPVTIIVSFAQLGSPRPDSLSRPLGADGGYDGRHQRSLRFV